MYNNIRNKVRIRESSYVIGLCCYEKEARRRIPGFFTAPAERVKTRCARVKSENRLRLNENPRRRRG